ncbi:MAG: c-type cytochrome domain-containing protein, partial [Planctomycetaceae bacterium]
MQPTGTYRFLTLFLLASLLTGVLSAQTPDDFSHAVLPILKTHCVPCHGGREAKGSFSMNTRELLVSSGHVVPGKPAESHLLE